MNKIKGFITISAFSLLVLCLPAIASAQYGNGGYGNGGYNNGGYNNGGYNNGHYGNYGNTKQVVKDLKNKAKDFQRQLDRDLDHSRYNGSRREDQINSLAKDFKNAVNRLNNSDNQNSNEVNQVLQIASQIDRSTGRGMSGNSQNIWNGIRYDLNQLRQSNGNYNNNNNGRGNNNGGWNNGGYGNGNGNGNGNRNGNGRGNNNNNRPSWWPF